MSELKAATDITISDRLSTQLQTEVKIKELTEKLQKTEAELEKYKSIIQLTSNPNTHVHEVSVEINGKVKKVSISNKELDYYLEGSSPVQAMLSDILDILVQPYREVVANELVGQISAIVKNRMIAVKGRAL